ncbi:hypothetical protein [Maribacter sp. 2-571]|uniref:MORN repeat-containing protein n=1 Tax=Maribacter sp. 2-571 TaxID=3417569 RepID=UPI003D34676E
MKSKKFIPYLLLALMTGIALWYRHQTIDLNKQLATTNTQHTEVTEQLNQYQELVDIDSLLVAGAYDDAVASYEKTLQGTENKMAVSLRIALAEKLRNTESKSHFVSSAMESEMDSLPITEENHMKDTRKLDSIQFILEKTEVKLGRLQRQLRQKSFGEYLQFKSKKGAWIHYVGQVKNGKANGHGIALLDTGSRYEGQWSDNQRHGEGTFYWADGQYYVGNYENDQRNGQGTYYWPNGEKYAGEWKEDKRSGTGQFFGSDGDIVAKGKWNDDKLVEAAKKPRK